MEEEDAKISKELDDIYFQMDDDWYSITNSSYQSRKKRVLEPVLPPLPEPIRDPTYAVLGSRIYAAGGTFPPEEGDDDEKERVLKLKKLRVFLVPSAYVCLPSNKVFYIDILHLKEGWKAAPPMNTSRVQPYMVADDGKMYVFGGLMVRHSNDPSDEDRIFSEVYDPFDSKAEWKKHVCITDKKIELPKTINGHAVVEDHLDRKIIFHNYYSKKLYYLSTTGQEFGDHDLMFGQHHPPSASFDGVLFFLSYSRMYAYDVSNSSGKYKLVVLRGVRTDTLPHTEDLDESRPRARLQSLGNWHLALIWARAIVVGKFVDVHCSIIKISDEGDLFVGNVVSYSTYSVKSGWLEGCMAVPSVAEDISLDAEYGKNSITSPSSSGEPSLPHYPRTNYELHSRVDGRKRGVSSREGYEKYLRDTKDRCSRKEDINFNKEAGKNIERSNKQRWRRKRY